MKVKNYGKDSAGAYADLSKRFEETMFNPVIGIYASVKRYEGAIVEPLEMIEVDGRTRQVAERIVEKGFKLGDYVVEVDAEKLERTLALNKK